MKRPVVYALLAASAEELQLSASQKLVLLTIASFHNPASGDVVWPSQPYVSELTGLDVRTVRRCLERLDELGYVTFVSSSGRGNCYRIHPDRLVDYSRSPEAIG